MYREDPNNAGYKKAFQINLGIWFIFDNDGSCGLFASFEMWIHLG
jgi:hypothetical protein